MFWDQVIHCDAGPGVTAGTAGIWRHWALQRMDAGTRVSRPGLKGSGEAWHAGPAGTSSGDPGPRVTPEYLTLGSKVSQQNQ